MSTPHPHPSIEDFCQRHFSWGGARALNRAALGGDLLRAPFNVFFAPAWLLLQLLAAVAQRARMHRLAEHLRAVPPGLTTRVQRELCHRIEAELLPALLPAQPDAGQQRSVRLALDGYIAARNGTAEIVANLVVLISGGLLFQRFTPGGLGWGQEVANSLHGQWALSQYWGGEWLGRVWFGWFPPQTPLWLTLACIALALAAIAITAALSGLLTDPVQNLLGLQQRRLQRMLRSLQSALDSDAPPQWRPPEPLLARLFDGLDWLRIGS